MLDTVVGIETSFTITQELPLSGDLIGEANTKYISDGAHKVSLPPVEGVTAVALGSVVLLEQVVGDGTIEDNVSQVGTTDDSGDNLAEITVSEGTTVGVILVLAYGRLQWMLLPTLLAVAAPPATADKLLTTNSGIDSVPTGAGVQRNLDESYSLYDPLDVDGVYVGMHIGPPAATTDSLHIILIW